MVKGKKKLNNNARNKERLKEWMENERLALRGGSKELNREGEERRGRVKRDGYELWESLCVSVRWGTEYGPEVGNLRRLQHDGLRDEAGRKRKKWEGVSPSWIWPDPSILSMAWPPPCYFLPARPSLRPTLTDPSPQPPSSPWGKKGKKSRSPSRKRTHVRISMPQR